MLVVNVICDICGAENIYSNMKDYDKDFVTVRINNKTTNVCHKCKEKHKRSGVYKKLVLKYPSIKRSSHGKGISG